jgi:hypothetical protein
MATLPQIFGKNFAFSQKAICGTSRFFLGECFAARVFYWLQFLTIPDKSVCS